MPAKPFKPSRRRGNVIVEFGLAFPLLFLLLSGLYQFGFAFFIYNQLQSVVRTGARYASRTDFEAAQGGSFFENRVKNVVVYGVPAGGSTPLVPGLTTSQVGVTWQADAAGIPQTVTIHISNFSFYAVFRTFTLSNKPRVTFIYLGQFISP
jgi:Flp pilus assembly protein TadG